MIERPTTLDYIERILRIFELHGDRYFRDDKSIGGIAALNTTNQ